MAEGGSSPMSFVSMTQINKATDDWDDRCTDWVATEKVHGSSFQFYTDDGTNIHVGSRRKNLDKEDSFLKCNVIDFLEKHRTHVIKLWNAINSEDRRWNKYKNINNVNIRDKDERVENNTSEGINKSEEPENGEEMSFNSISDRDGKEVVCHNVNKQECFSANENNGLTGDLGCSHSKSKEKDGRGVTNSNDKIIDEGFQLRIYGELYGGGGVDADATGAVQKQIIYCDDYRFYVFGVTVDRKWLTISELGVLCEEAGFPFYAKPVNEVPQRTVGDLKVWLEENGFMRSKSTLTERKDDKKTFVEGFVLTPLTKIDHRLHAIKYLASAFNDVRVGQKNNKVTKYCTKQRYNSVISKLGDEERRDKQLVVDMMTADIIAERQDGEELSKKESSICRKTVLEWLKQDGYITREEARERESDKGKMRGMNGDEGQAGEGGGSGERG